MRGTPSERFWPKVEKRSAQECWPWVASFAGRGYGHFWVSYERRLVPSHVFALEEHLGRRLRPGMRGLHSCDNRSCCNPAHLFEGTQKDNIADMIAKGRGNLQNGSAPRGEDHPHTKLTRAQVDEIRSIKGIRQADIGARFGLTQSAVSKIVRGDSWR